MDRFTPQVARLQHADRVYVDAQDNRGLAAKIFWNKKFQLALKVAAGVVGAIIVIGLVAPAPDVPGPFTWDETTKELGVGSLTVEVPSAQFRTPAEEYGGNGIRDRSEIADRVGLGWQTITPWQESVVARGPLANIHVKHAVAYLAIPNGAFSIRVGAGILYDGDRANDGPNSAFNDIERGEHGVLQLAKYTQNAGERTCYIDYGSYRPSQKADPLSQGFLLVDDPELPPLVFFVGGASGENTNAVFNSIVQQIC